MSVLSLTPLAADSVKQSPFLIVLYIVFILLDWSGNESLAKGLCNVLGTPVNWHFINPCLLARRSLTTTQEETKGQCLLLPAKESEISGDNASTPESTPVPQQLQDVVTHMEKRTDFSTDTLRSLYLSLLSGLVDTEDASVQEDVETLIDTALATVDTNQDGIINAKEMEMIQLPPEAGEFLFDDVVACTSTTTTTASGETCVAAPNVVDFLNQFYGGQEIVGSELKQHLMDTSGVDACYTRAEWETAFGLW